MSAAKYIAKHFILLPVLGTEVQGDFHKPGSCTCAALKNTLRGCLSPSSTAGWPVKHLADGKDTPESHQKVLQGTMVPDTCATLSRRPQN